MGIVKSKDDGNVVLADKRDAKDHITSVAFNSNFTEQTEESTQPESSGAAFGASTIVQNIDRTVKTSILEIMFTQISHQ